MKFDEMKKGEAPVATEHGNETRSNNVRKTL